MSCRPEKEIASLAALYPVRISLQQDSPGAGFSSRTESFGKAPCHRGWDSSYLFPTITKPKFHRFADRHCRGTVPPAGGLYPQPECAEVSAWGGVRQRPLGHPCGYCALYRPGFLPEHPHDHDGAPDYGKPSEAAKVRQKQEHSGDRRFRLRQDPVLLQTLAAASPFFLCGHRPQRVTIIRIERS